MNASWGSVVGWSVQELNLITKVFFSPCVLWLFNRLQHTTNSPYDVRKKISPHIQSVFFFKKISVLFISNLCCSLVSPFLRVRWVKVNGVSGKQWFIQIQNLYILQLWQANPHEHFEHFSCHYSERAWSSAILFFLNEWWYDRIDDMFCCLSCGSGYPTWNKETLVGWITSWVVSTWTPPLWTLQPENFS